MDSTLGSKPPTANIEPPSISRFPLNSLSVGFAEVKLEEPSPEGVHQTQQQISPPPKDATDWSLYPLFYSSLLFSSICVLNGFGQGDIDLHTFILQMSAFASLFIVGTAFFLSWFLSESPVRRTRLSIALVGVSAFGYAVADERFASTVTGAIYSGSAGNSFVPVSLVLLGFSTCTIHRPGAYMSAAVLCGVSIFAFQACSKRVISALMDFGLFMALHTWKRTLF